MARRLRNPNHRWNFPLLPQKNFPDHNNTAHSENSTYRSFIDKEDMAFELSSPMKQELEKAAPETERTSELREKTAKMEQRWEKHVAESLIDERHWIQRLVEQDVTRASEPSNEHFRTQTRLFDWHNEAGDDQDVARQWLRSFTGLVSMNNMSLGNFTVLYSDMIEAWQDAEPEDSERVARHDEYVHSLHRASRRREKEHAGRVPDKEHGSKRLQGASD